ncbi:MAG TPA: protein kinase [Mycobacteriales bacterium]|nr:protein kinase [Mycobacteriales bacterium]
MSNTAVGAGSVLSGRYRLLEPLASGGMGTVWRAVDLLLDRPVAIKEVRLPPGLDDEARTTLRRRTIREAQAAARLRHTAIVTVFDVVEQDDRPWIVMELVHSRSLAQVIRQDGPLPPARVASIGLRILGAMVTADAGGVQHRDIKPANVLITDEGRVVLTDFGIARHVGDETLTSAGLLLGSPDYLAPERARGQQSPGLASDLWSLGALMYDAVEGRRPFAREGALPTLAAVVMDEPDPPLRAGPLRPVIDGLLAKNPAHRLDAERTRAMLERVVRGRSSGGTMPFPRDLPTLRRARVDPGRISEHEAGERIGSPPDPAPSDSGQRQGPAEPAPTAARPQLPAEASEPEDAAGPVDASTSADPVRSEPTPQPAAADPAPPAQRAADSPARPEPAAQPLAAAPEPAAQPATADPDRPEHAAQPATADPARPEPAAQPVAAAPEPAARPVAADPEPAARADPQPAAQPVAADPEPVAQPVDAGPDRAHATAEQAAAGPAQATAERAAAGPQRPAEQAAPRETGTPPAPADPRPSTDAAPGEHSRRRPAILAGAALLAIALLAAVLVPQLSKDDPSSAAAPPASSTAPSPSVPAAAPGTPSTAATSTATPSAGPTSPSASPSPAPAPTGAAVTAPAGFTRYTDPRDGFSLIIPAGWRPIRRDTRVDFDDPTSSRFLRIDTSDRPLADPYQNWIDYERSYRRGKTDYHRIGIRRVPDYRAAAGWTTADWEFTIGSTHVLDRNIRVSDSRAHAIYWSTPSSRWTAADSRRIFTIAAASFVPAPTGR